MAIHIPVKTNKRFSAVPEPCLLRQQKAHLKVLAVSDFEVGFFTTLLGQAIYLKRKWVPTIFLYHCFEFRERKPLPAPP